MGNNQNKKAKKDSVSIGNFIVTFDTGKLKSVKITAAAGNWNIRFREDNILYTWISKELKSKEGREILHIVFSAYFAVCNGIPDSEFVEDIFNAYTRSAERMKKEVTELSEQENQEILKEEKERHTTFNADNNEIRN